MISTSTAHVLAALFVTCYVGSIYISKDARLSFSNTKVSLDYGFARPKLQNERWRDDPDVIRARLVAVCSGTFICCAIVHALMASQSANAKNSWTPLQMTVNYLGCTSTSILPHLITPMLFLGPLYAHFLRGTLPGQCNWSFQEDLLSFLFSVTGVRNYFVAPITEEVVFRASVLTVYHLAQVSKIRMIFLCPLLFGAAHAHHAWETYNRYGRSPAALKRAAIGTVFQFTYTSIFGFYCSYLFLRTGSIFPPITAHVFCNIMGVPQPGYDIMMISNAANKQPLLLPTSLVSSDLYPTLLAGTTLPPHSSQTGWWSAPPLPGQMPHKRAKRSVREREKAQRATDLAPTISIEHESIPKSVSRVLDAGQIRREYRKKKRQLDGVGNSDEGDGRHKKRRHNTTEMNDGETTALRIKPGETVTQFNRRVETGMTPLIRTALRQSSAQARRVRREAAAQETLKRGKQGDNARHPPPASSKKGSDPPPTAAAHEENIDRRSVTKEFQVVSTSAPRRLNDVAQEPPLIKKLPRGAKHDAAPSGVLSMAQKVMMEEERDKAIRRYRELKAGKLRESGGVKLDS
ncbi:hypothetical protein JVT61DRAFT_2810 [Boletus reticuloceps]|uniref:intramembrane prenyl-peptidase Rce1 n=1 Tax=Boletus reticuloceps TaxID=495285 RepID=A0A8I2YN51_9AGAM|nr:hypothetical protein JVT61DRAFT_2810 [Boletus reticuloceps]